LTARVHDFPATGLDGRPMPLSAWAGKPLLIVNVASQCGYTPQYRGLEQLWKDFGPRGLVVVGFPCNQFGAQEPGSAEQIATFCERNYGVSFPLSAKVEVNGPGADPLYVHLKAAAPGADGKVDIPWNFTKFLVSADGLKVERFAPGVTPESLRARIEVLLPA
jgi:glutathione peroxidase